ncbi:MBL fold metallo-hydrolase [Halodesulfovibrio sp.]|uniref:MBL fold metallo-hydrolase n=1 Tax=Halodesulfovibrio sp. TaxID=1912772 RepID=UPI0025C62259|nr:MBL fold metallo-hydrolase [Halodesulfovibrio sp.]
MAALHEVDAVEILSLQDNYIDVLTMDSSDVVQRPALLSKTSDHAGDLLNSPLAEHGYSAFITVTFGDDKKSMLFDFGCSERGAAFNAELLAVDLTQVDELALSHGHFDHFGGMEELVRLTGKRDLELVAHPAAFKERFVKTPSGLALAFPKLRRDEVQKMGIRIHETTSPHKMLDNHALFLGEIPRKTSFEKGMPNAFYLEKGEQHHDVIEDDSSMVFVLRDKGLVVLSGCAHAGIINTVKHAQSVTGVSDIYAIMGGFHLSGPFYEQFIGQTVEALQALSPKYIVPAHCTGRKATQAIESAMTDAFICNMSGTTMKF